MATTGSDSRVAVSSCILDAESRLTVSGWLDLVLDLLRVLPTLMLGSFATPLILAGSTSL
jgi:hypothetical protein